MQKFSMPLRALFSSLVFFIVIGVVSLQGCGSSGQQQRFHYSDCSEVVPFSNKSLPVPPALKNAKCGFLVVPENRSNFSLNTVQLAVVIIPSVSQPAAPDPVVYLAGGPGGSAFFEIDSLISDGVNQRRDLILMSQRGTLFSRPELMCPELDEFYVQSLNVPLDSEANRQQHITASRSCYLRLAQQGIDLSAYNTVESAADFADLRTALGIQEWDVFGVSYGTYLAQTLMFQHPDGIRSVTLDSVVPLENGAVPASAAKNAREGFDNLFAACAEEKQCAKHYPNLSTTFTKLVNQLESDPVLANVQLKPDDPPTQIALDGGLLVNWLINESFDTSDYQNVPSLIKELNNGLDQKIVKSYALPFMQPRGMLAYGMTFGMVCSGYIADETDSVVLTQGRLAFPNYPDSVLAPALHFGYIHDDCRIWNIAKTPKKLRAAKQSAIPTLILSGSFDAVTPPSTGAIVAHTLPLSTKLVFPGVGHGVINGSRCAQDVFASFLTSPDAPDTNCVADLAPPVFNTSG